MAVCAAGCLVFLGSLAAVAWGVQVSVAHSLGRWGSEGAWLGLPDFFEWFDRPGGGAILLPAALIVPLVLPLRRSQYWWLPVAVLLGSWALAGIAADALAYLGLGGDEVACPDTNTVTAVAFLVTCAHLIQRSLTGRLIRVAFWTGGALLIALASLDPITFDPAHMVPLGRVAGAGFGLACAAAAASWDEAAPRRAACWVRTEVRLATAVPAGLDLDHEPGEANAEDGHERDEATPAIARVLYHLYEQRLLRQVQTGPKPRHVGVILDGNRRYARQRGLTDLPTVYRLGAQKLDDVLDWCAELRIPAVTLWVCSTNNLDRSSDQVSGILAAVEAKLKALAHDPQIQRQQVRVQAIGRLELLPETTVAAIRAAETATERHAAITLTIAVAYGGREEIVDAVRGLLADEAERGAELADVIGRVTPAAIGRHLYVTSLPDPELIIRTSGEIRVTVRSGPPVRRARRRVEAHVLA